MKPNKITLDGIEISMARAETIFKKFHIADKIISDWETNPSIIYTPDGEIESHTEAAKEDELDPIVDEMIENAEKRQTLLTTEIAAIRKEKRENLIYRITLIIFALTFLIILYNWFFNR